MKEAILKRLNELYAQQRKGHKAISDQEICLAGLRGTMLRLEGAIQVLEELQNEERAE